MNFRIDLTQFYIIFSRKEHQVERALCALYLYKSLDSKDTSLHNWVESVTNPEQDIVIKMDTEAIQKLKTSGMKYMLIQILRGNRAFNRL